MFTIKSMTYSKYGSSKKNNYLSLKGRRLQANKHSTEVTVGQYRYRELDIIDTGIGCFDTDKAGRTRIKLDEMRLHILCCVRGIRVHVKRNIKTKRIGWIKLNSCVSAKLAHFKWRSIGA